MPSTSKRYGYNADPRLSANQLAEYLKASSTRRKSIVRDAKFPKTAVVARYRFARQSIIEYLCDDSRSPRRLFESMANLHSREESPVSTPWQKDDFRLSGEAIDTFQKAVNALGISKLDCRLPMSSPPKVRIAGVDISVSADVFPVRTESDGTHRVGAVILLFSKSESSAKGRDDLCRVSAILAAMFCERHLAHMGIVDPKMCIAIDVFGGKAHRAPGTYVRHLDNMNNACEEVALRWPIVEAPADYDGPTIYKKTG